MLLDPPFDRLRPADDGGPSERVAIDLPADLAAWLSARCGDDPTRRNDYVTLALDALQQFEQADRWPDLTERPRPRTPEEIAALRAEIAAIEVPQEEKDALDDWLREREEERDRWAAQNEAADRAEAEANQRAAA